jgi:putative FmdB family regulatory protein
MPLYEYKCDNCGNLFEAVQKFADPYLTVHEACGGGPVHRLISVPSLQFKGTGFYITDYAKGSGPGSAGNAPHKKNESGGGSESKSDSGSSTPAASASSSESKSSSSESKSSSSDSKSSSDKK